MTDQFIERERGASKKCPSFFRLGSKKDHFPDPSNAFLLAEKSRRSPRQSFSLQVLLCKCKKPSAGGSSKSVLSLINAVCGVFSLLLSWHVRLDKEREKAHMKLFQLTKDHDRRWAKSPLVLKKHLLRLRSHAHRHHRRCGFPITKSRAKETSSFPSRGANTPELTLPTTSNVLTTHHVKKTSSMAKTIILREDLHWPFIYH